jgi:lipid-A-disaccharide synthase
MKLLISCAEYSGDLLASEIISELHKLGNYSSIGICGPKMRSIGVEPFGNMEDINTMGFIGVLSKLPTIINLQRKVQQQVLDVDALICFDSSSFHLPILHKSKQRGIKSIGICSPQIWAWRKNRISKIVKSMHSLYCLFSFECDLYPSSFDAKWVGHPILDRIQPRKTSQQDLFGLLPGSRKQEITTHLPIFLQVAATIRETIPNATFICSTPDRIEALPQYVQWVAGGATSMKECRAVLSKSGTCTLELAVMKVPMVVAHRINPGAYRFVANLIETPFISLPNILSNEKVVPEFIQHLDISTLAKELLNCTEQQIDLSSLGSRGAAGRIANEIHRTLHE